MANKRKQQQRLPPLRIGIVGGGCVAGGVVEILTGLSQQQQQQNTSVIISKICVKHLSKPRSFHLDSKISSLVTDIYSILNDESIDVVVELMGGTTTAKTVVLEALQRGKHVVTANKDLVAEYWGEIQAAARQSASQFCFEGAVCGGIPIIQILQSSYAADVVFQIMAICHATSNYTLGKMEQSRLPFEQAHEQTQQELLLDTTISPDNSDEDVDGRCDVRAKIAILANLAFGVTVQLNEIPCRGISELTPTDFEYAKLLHCTIKLLGTAGRMSRFAQYDGALSVYVSPVMVPNSHLLATARGTGNCVAVTSGNMGLCSYTGPGAGRFPTANSVVADILRIASNDQYHQSTTTSTTTTSTTTVVDLDHDYTRPFYVRIPFMDSIGIIRKVGELAEANDVSIHSILQNPIVDRMEADFCLTTEECKLSQVQALCHDLLQQTDFVRGEPLYMPLLWELT